MAKLETPKSRPVMGLISPKPVVLVTCADERGRPNIITIAAVAGASHEPPMFVISVREDRYSYQLIDKTREYVINVPTVDMVEQVIFCGRLSGRNVDKFKEAKLTPSPAKVVKPPLIAECPINIECKVVAAIKPGTHMLYVGQVVATHVEEGAFDGTKLDLRRFQTLTWNQVEYLRPGEVIRRL
jgi:flavin reductase (DIM6/NTAB) family NADH-FMN oxidoreductase RutF